MTLDEIYPGLILLRHNGVAYEAEYIPDTDPPGGVRHGNRWRLYKYVFQKSSWRRKIKRPRSLQRPRLKTIAVLDSLDECVSFVEADDAKGER